MIVDTIIGSVKKYFTSLSVDSTWGYTKVALIEADNSKLPTGASVIIDATTTLNLTVSKQVMQHASESKKVYMDGAKINPNKISISGHIETTKLAEIERLAGDDVWMYVSHTKDMGGAYYSAGGGNPLTISNVVDTVRDPIGAVKDTFGFGDGDSASVYTDCKLYTITSLSLSDTGFMNTVAVTIDLIEVVLFEYDIQYKYGTNTTNKKIQNTKADLPDKNDAPMYDTAVGLVGGSKW